MITQWMAVLMGGGGVLNLTIYIWGREGRYSVEDEGRIPLDQQDPQPLEQVPDGFLLLLASAPGLSSGKFSQLFHCLLVPTF